MKEGRKEKEENERRKEGRKEQLDQADAWKQIIRLSWNSILICTLYCVFRRLVLIKIKMNIYK